VALAIALFVSAADADFQVTEISPAVRAMDGSGRQVKSVELVSEFFMVTLGLFDPLHRRLFLNTNRPCGLISNKLWQPSKKGTWTSIAQFVQMAFFVQLAFCRRHSYLNSQS
jgi:hypothetical protein